mmetsp:Transcript_44886/g.142955  ORF Transcript_44886/g.142955 Transcript_44886/m.142955 type:complete len:213 (+) Transcript_44886:1185-1823(+)
MACSDCSSVPMRTKAHPTPLCACEAITNTSNTSPNSSKHSWSICLVTSRGKRPTNSFTPPFSRSMRGRLSAGLDSDFRWRQLGDLWRPRRAGRRLRERLEPQCEGLRDQRQPAPLAMGAPPREGERLGKPGDLLRRSGERLRGGGERLQGERRSRGRRLRRRLPERLPQLPRLQLLGLPMARGMRPPARRSAARCAHARPLELRRSSKQPRP